MLCEFGARIAQLSARIRGSSYWPAFSHGKSAVCSGRVISQPTPPAAGKDRAAADQGKGLPARQAHGRGSYMIRYQTI